MKIRFILTVLLFWSIPSFGWGPTGHRTTGQVAEKYLTKKARAAVESLLGGKSMAMISTWMDEVRSDSAFDHMVPWHFVDIPSGLSYEQSKKNPKGDIIATLDRIIHELKSGKLSRDQQARNIKILIHLVGDLHMPLHVGPRPDHGGNKVKVEWFGNTSNLHKVWDSDMIDETRLSYTELAASLDSPSESELKKWQKSSVRDWAVESMAYENQVYDIGNGKLGYKYSYLYWHIVRHRLLQAGVRIAGILNGIYGK